MIIKEYYGKRYDGVDLFRIYSTNGVKIRRYIIDKEGNGIETNDVYNEKIDVADVPYIYEETNIPIFEENN